MIKNKNKTILNLFLYFNRNEGDNIKYLCKRFLFWKVEGDIWRDVPVSLEEVFAKAVRNRDFAWLFSVLKSFCGQCKKSDRLLVVDVYSYDPKITEFCVKAYEESNKNEVLTIEEIDLKWQAVNQTSCCFGWESIQGFTSDCYLQ